MESGPSRELQGCVFCRKATVSLVGKQEPSHGVELPCRETAVAAAVWGHTNRPGRLELPPLALCVISPNSLPQPVLVQKPQATLKAQ